MQNPTEAYEFARKTAGEVIQALDQYHNSQMTVNTYAPIRISGDDRSGFIRLLFQKEDMPVVQMRLGFGETDGDGEIIRFGFNQKAWEEHTGNPYSSGINALNFDEAWQIVCLIGSELTVHNVSISYGN